MKTKTSKKLLAIAFVAAIVATLLLGTVSANTGATEVTSSNLTGEEKVVLKATLATKSGDPIYDFQLRKMLDRFIPTNNSHSTLLIFTECYGGDKMDDFEGRDGTTVLSATSKCETATYGGYDDDAADALKPGKGRTSDDVHKAGVAGKAKGETPQKQGPGASLEPTNPEGKIKSRHVLVYAGQPDPKKGRDNDQRDAIVKNFAGQSATTVTTVGGDGTGGWDYSGTMEGLKKALKAIEKNMSENEQFILFVTDHGDKHSCKENVMIAGPGAPTIHTIEIPEPMYEDMIYDQSNQPDFSIFTSGPMKLPSLEGLSVNGEVFEEFEVYALDYNGNGEIEYDEGYEYIFPIDEDVLVQGENFIEIFISSAVWHEIVSPLMSLGSGAIAKLEAPITASITVDSFEYCPGDTMTVTIDLANPTEDSLTFQWYWLVPQFSVCIPVTLIPVSIPAGYDETLEYSFAIPNWGATGFGNVFYVQLAEEAGAGGGGEVLDVSTAGWIYSPSREAGTEATPVEEANIANEIKKTVENIGL